MYLNYIFDLYGTLVDIRTNEKKNYLWGKLANYYSLQGAKWETAELKREYRKLVTEKEHALAANLGVCPSLVEISIEDVFRALYEKKGVHVSKECIDGTCLMFRTLSLEYLRLFDGAKDLLERLRKSGKKVYLLSNAQRIFTEAEMRMLDIYDSFDGIFYSSDVGVKKPSVAFFDALFERFGLEKQKSVMIGNDHIADMEGACAYGIDGIYIYTPQSPKHPEQLPKRCEEIREIAEVFR